ncbi:hypothetical protein MCBG_03311 [Micromonospora sp. M42]|nr:hypothetical protein MCBG_03311 [Micromonospora sp. M42]
MRRSTPPITRRSNDMPASSRSGAPDLPIMPSPRLRQRPRRVPIVTRRAASPRTRYLVGVQVAEQDRR